MAQVIVRKLDATVVERLRDRARLRGRSLEQELRLILTEASRSNMEEVLAEMDRIRAKTLRGHRSDSTALVREDRDSR